MREVFRISAKFPLQSCVPQASVLSFFGVLLMCYSVYHVSGFTKKGTWRLYVGSTYSMDFPKYFHTTSDRPKYMRCWPNRNDMEKMLPSLSRLFICV